MRSSEPDSAVSVVRTPRSWGIAGIGAAVVASIIGVAAAAQAGGGTPVPTNSDDAYYRNAAPQDTASPSVMATNPPPGLARAARPAALSPEERRRVFEHAEQLRRSGRP